MSLFELRDAGYGYDGIPALDGCSLEIEQGSRVAILGANGSGKSTLLRMLDALCFPERGTLHFDGSELNEAAMRDEARAVEFRRRVGMVFQNPDVQLFNPTVFDELAFGPLQLGWSDGEIRTRVEETMVRFGIAGLRDRSPHRLSGGEKKRVCIASVFAIDPEVLLLDEPTAALDPAGQNVMIDLLHDLRQGRTVVVATHDLGVVEDIADVCLVMERGRVVAGGPTGEIVRDEELLRRTGLLHVHRHAHGDVRHSHPHRHHDHRH